ncbi:MAG: hypothetical protein AAGI91_17445 [Bacteroidota bacterium]
MPSLVCSPFPAPTCSRRAVGVAEAVAVNAFYGTPLGPVALDHQPWRQRAGGIVEAGDRFGFALATGDFGDVPGREVARLADGEIPAGRHEAVLDDSTLPSDVYLVRLAADGVVRTERVTLVR